MLRALLVLLPLVYLAAVTPALWATDVREHRLPNRLVVPGYPVALATVAARWALDGHPPSAALAGGGLYFALLLALSYLGGMGMGDVKLAGVLGLTAGLLGPGAAVAAPVLAFLLGGVVAAVSLARGRTGSLAFGPYMLAGFWGAVVLGWLGERA